MRFSRWTFALLVAGGTLLLFSACGDGRDGPPMMRMMGDQNMELPEGIAAEELPDPESRGARLVARYCSSCHGIPSTRRHSAEDWEASARRMFRRMRHMDRMGGMMGRMHRGRMSDVEAPTAAEERAILVYLQEHAMRGAQETDLPAGEGREVFADQCGRCHALPDPGQHTPEEWPAVVERMRENMRQMDVGGMSDGEAEHVVRYLQEAASADQR